MNLRNAYYVGFVMVVLLTSCYSYGPIHIPYGDGVRKELPPPPTKVVAAPITKAEYMKKTFGEIKYSLNEAVVVMIEDSIKILFPNNILFNSKDVSPSGDYHESIDKFSVLLKKHKHTNILILGHTDNKGSDVKNKQLAKFRAENLKSILVGKSIASQRFETWGIGASSPIFDNSTSEGRNKNRRVEFVVLYDEN